MSRSTRRLVQNLLILIAVLTASGTVGASWKAHREALDRRLVSADFHIYYTLAGENAFAADIPPGTEREIAAASRLTALSEQLALADRYFRETLGLRSPLAGERYGVGRGIDIHIVKLEDKSGSAGDQLQRFNYRHFPPRAQVLSIALSNRWKPTSLTPAHELFHLYQYGYTFFKTAWYLEGMARSSEDLFRVTQNIPPTLPDSALKVADEVRRSYGSAGLWSRLWGICGDRFFGHVLDEFKKLDSVAARDRGINPIAWPEEEQRSRLNTPYLLRGIENALESGCKVTATPELQRFKEALATAAATPGSPN